MVQAKSETGRAVESELREVSGSPKLSGVLIQEGRIARRRAEVFAPGSIQWPGNGIGVQVGHHSPVEVRAMPVRSPGGHIEISARTTPAIVEAVESGKSGLSVQFYSLEETRNASGVREIREALVTHAALVENPEYSQGRAELRDTGRLRFWL